MTKVQSDSGGPLIAALKRPFIQFAQLEAGQGLLLLACTVTALAWANSPLAGLYDALWHTELAIHIGRLTLSHSLLHWINDGLMAVFFFVVGLEIKRETLVGELATGRRAALPIVAALGGMVVPAGIYYVVNRGGPAASGWGIPMATDIAFALGVMALLGRAVPVSLKIFLTALAIVDDIGAVLVIAFFYTSHLSMAGLGMAAVFLALLVVANRLGVRHPLVYLILGVGLWFGFMQGGIHATLAGVVLAMTIPARARIEPDAFAEEGLQILDRFGRADDAGATLLSSERQQSAVHALESACERVQAPLHRMETALHPWVSYFIMPVFALANAGVALSGGLLGQVGQPVSIGIVLGLVLGKPIGVAGFSWLAIRTGLADSPRHANWRQILGVGCLAGIGFTMSLFIANLGLHPDLLALGKLAILGGSILSGVLGWLLLRKRMTGEA